jgi:S-adenosylmethionine-dependent methyltransferase
MRRDAADIETHAIAGAVDLPGRRVLEVGCGEGRVTAMLARTARSVLAIDSNADTIEKARAAVPVRWRRRVRFAVADAETFEPEPATADVVVFGWVL